MGKGEREGKIRKSSLINVYRYLHCSMSALTWKTVAMSELFLMCMTPVEVFPHSTLPKLITGSSMETWGPGDQSHSTSVWILHKCTIDLHPHMHIHT